MNNCVQTSQTNTVGMEEYLKQQAQIEQQVDYHFIKRIIQEITQSCALPLPLPASAIPPLILQAAQKFWEDYDWAVEERYYCVRNIDFCRYCLNNVIKLPQRIISVFGVYKTTNSFNYGVMGDFSLERMILNNSALASGAGGSLSDVFGSGTGYNLTDVMGALYEVQTYKAMFDVPLTFNFNPGSHKLVILGDLGHSDLVLQCYLRCKIQDLYENYYFFRYCVALGMRGLATIIGSYEFKMPGNVGINYQRFHDMAVEELDKIDEYIKSQHSADYFFMSNTV